MLGKIFAMLLLRKAGFCSMVWVFQQNNQGLSWEALKPPEEFSLHSYFPQCP